MSVTESKAKTERKSSRKPAKTQETVLSALLVQTEEVSVPLASLIKSPLNVRTVPYSVESVSELAESIKGVGLLQNLVVHTLPGDRYGGRPCDDGADCWSGVLYREITTPFLVRGFFPDVLCLSSYCAGRSGCVTGMMLALILLINKQHNTGYL